MKKLTTLIQMTSKHLLATIILFAFFPGLNAQITLYNGPVSVTGSSPDDTNTDYISIRIFADGTTATNDWNYGHTNVACQLTTGPTTNNRTYLGGIYSDHIVNLAEGDILNSNTSFAGSQSVLRWYPTFTSGSETLNGTDYLGFRIEENNALVRHADAGNHSWHYGWVRFSWTVTYDADANGGGGRFTAEITFHEWAINSDLNQPIEIGSTVPVAGSTPDDPSSITANPTTLCAGGSTQLTAVGAQGTVHWYTGSCGVTPASPSTGNPITVSPSSTTTYYARNYENGVFSTDCALIEIKVFELQQFRSTASGNWTESSKWQQYNGSGWVPALCYPGQFAGTDPDALVSIRAGHEIHIPNGTNIDIPKLDIKNTGKLTIKPGGKFNVHEKLELEASTAAAIVVE